MGSGRPGSCRSREYLLVERDEAPLNLGTRQRPHHPSLSLSLPLNFLLVTYICNMFMFPNLYMSLITLATTKSFKHQHRTSPLMWLHYHFFCKFYIVYFRVPEYGD